MPPSKESPERNPSPDHDRELITEHDVDQVVPEILKDCCITDRSTDLIENRIDNKEVKNMNLVESNGLIETSCLENGKVIDKVIETPCLENGQVTEKFVRDLIQYYKNLQRLSTTTCFKILSDAKALFTTEPSLVDVHVERDDVIVVCGDIHGQFFDLARILEEVTGFPSKSNQYLFNGDFVDRGPWSVEVAFLLLSLKLLYPRHFFLNRGNHESEDINKLYGFQNEVIDKYDARMFAAFQEVFDWLPVAHCINDSILVMHGGLFCSDDVTLDDIRAIQRGCQPPRHGIMCDLLWSDPQEELGRFPNTRGFSCLFGPDITESFLAKNNLNFIIRSHECVPYGYDLCHDDKVITVFSAPNYCDRYGNKGAVCILHGDDVTMPEFRKFEAAPHPDVRAMTYASLFLRLGLV